jgi:hypothetical protein
VPDDRICTFTSHCAMHQMNRRRACSAPFAWMAESERACPVFNAYKRSNVFTVPHLVDENAFAC